jgi:hypothetical protein
MHWQGCFAPFLMKKENISGHVCIVEFFNSHHPESVTHPYFFPNRS